MGYWDGADGDARVELLSRLYALGLSAGKIAAQMPTPRPSRNAVIGKIVRLGLNAGGARRTNSAAMRLKRKMNPAPGPKPGPQPMRWGRATVANTLGPVPASYVEPVADVPVADRLALVDLEAHHCRWPLGDPKEPGFGFCPAHKVPGLPYCEPHARRAVIPMPVRRGVRAGGQVADGVGGGSGPATVPAKTDLETV